MTIEDANYIARRMKKEGYAPKKGFWYHFQQDIRKNSSSLN
jgi:hypothetical protein